MWHQWHQQQQCHRNFVDYINLRLYEVWSDRSFSGMALWNNIVVGVILVESTILGIIISISFLFYLALDRVVSHSILSVCFSLSQPHTRRDDGDGCSVRGIQPYGVYCVSRTLHSSQTPPLRPSFVSSLPRHVVKVTTGS